MYIENSKMTNLIMIDTVTHSVCYISSSSCRSQSDCYPVELGFHILMFDHHNSNGSNLHGIQVHVSMDHNQLHTYNLTLMHVVALECMQKMSTPFPPTVTFLKWLFPLMSEQAQGTKMDRFLRFGD